MRKIVMALILIILAFSMVACQSGGRQPPITDVSPQPVVASDAAVDAVGDDLENLNDIEGDLSADELDDLDSGLGDVENI